MDVEREINLLRELVDLRNRNAALLEALEDSVNWMTALIREHVPTGDATDAAWLECAKEVRDRARAAIRAAKGEAS